MSTIIVILVEVEKWIVAKIRVGYSIPFRKMQLFESCSPPPRRV